jgi:hypothetical protein
VRRLFAGVTQSAQLEQRFLHHDGHPVWVSLSASLVRDLYDQPMYLVCQVEDIGERRASGEALAHQAVHDPLSPVSPTACTSSTGSAVSWRAPPSAVSALRCCSSTSTGSRS